MYNKKQDKMTQEQLRMQMLAGIITESEPTQNWWEGKKMDLSLIKNINWPDFVLKELEQKFPEINFKTLVIGGLFPEEGPDDGADDAYVVSAKDLKGKDVDKKTLKKLNSRRDKIIDIVLNNWDSYWKSQKNTPKMTNEQLRMQMLAGIITESQYKKEVEEIEVRGKIGKSYPAPGFDSVPDKENQKDKENERYEFMGKPDHYKYIVAYFNEDRSRKQNPDLKKHTAEIIQTIKDDWGDKYNPDKEHIKYLQKHIKDKYAYYEKRKNDPEFQKDLKNINIARERYKNNLLPLTYSGSVLDRPNPKYYSDSTKYYSYTDSYGNSRSMGGEGREYTLDSNHLNTQVDKETLDKHWKINVLRYLGLKR